MNLIQILPKSFRDRHRNAWHKIYFKNDAGFIQKIKWKINRPKTPVLDDKAVYLHLGCGNVNHPDFVNVDLVPHPHVHFLNRIDKLSFFSDGSVDLIYASHCLEHFPFRQVPSVLKEWARVIKRDGTLRLSVPDFDTIVDTYIASGRDLSSVDQAIVGGQDYKYNFHYAIFNQSHLSALLASVGFVDVKVWLPGTTELTTFDDWSGKTFKVGDKEYPISLNLEAKKA